MIIDGHNHVWPAEIAAKALGGNIPDMQYFGDGTISGLATAQDEAGIGLFEGAAGRGIDLERRGGERARFAGGVRGFVEQVREEQIERRVGFGAVVEDAGAVARAAAGAWARVEQGAHALAGERVTGWA